MANVIFEPQSEIGEFIHPWSAMICGVSGSGKTVFLSKIINETMKKRWHTIYVTCKGYPIEEEKQIVELRDRYGDNITVAQARDMSENTILKIRKLLSSLPREQPKHLIFDNFTYDLSESLLNFLTINRKLNTSVSLLMHDLFSNPKLGPRLRGTLKYSVLFYLGSNVNNLKFFLTTDEMKEQYLKEVRFKNYKKLIWKNQENIACIADGKYTPKVGVDKDLIPNGEEIVDDSVKFSEFMKPALGQFPAFPQAAAMKGQSACQPSARPLWSGAGSPSREDNGQGTLGSVRRMDFSRRL